VRGVKELSEILAALRAGAPEGVALVTVVAVEGSTYRRPGARMLVTPTGRIGSISGGCLEDEVCRKAWWLAEKGPVVVTYDTGLDEELGAAAGYALGCRGRVTVLIERIDAARPEVYLPFIEENQAAGRPCTVATVIGVEGMKDLKIGDRPMLVSAERELPGQGIEVIPGLKGQVRESVEQCRSRHIALELPSGSAHVFIEVVPPPVQLLVFGAGHDAEPLVAMAKELGWRVTLSARRLTPGVRHRFARADQVLQVSPALMREVVHAGLSSRAAAIVMSHDYATDLLTLEQVLGSSVEYVGVLGPRHRTDTLISDIAAHGGELNPDSLGRIHAPVGLDIGAESPEQVALSVIAEVQAFYADRAGGPLRDRSGPIHDAVDGPAAANTLGSSCGLDRAL
jgi:xanthine/CO dehydrogenase XdhC/CoxF family maturation factor